MPTDLTLNIDDQRNTNETDRGLQRGDLVLTQHGGHHPNWHMVVQTAAGRHKLIALSGANRNHGVEFERGTPIDALRQRVNDDITIKDHVPSNHVTLTVQIEGL